MKFIKLNFSFIFSLILFSSFSVNLFFAQENNDNSFIRNFKYTYKVSTEDNEIYREREYNVAKATPLNNFLINIINIVNLLTKDVRADLLENIKD